MEQSDAYFILENIMLKRLPNPLIKTHYTNGMQKNNLQCVFYEITPILQPYHNCH